MPVTVESRCARHFYSYWSIRLSIRITNVHYLQTHATFFSKITPFFLEEMRYVMASGHGHGSNVYAKFIFTVTAAATRLSAVFVYLHVHLIHDKTRQPSARQELSVIHSRITYTHYLTCSNLKRLRLQLIRNFRL